MRDPEDVEILEDRIRIRGIIEVDREYFGTLSDVALSDTAEMKELGDYTVLSGYSVDRTGDSCVYCGDKIRTGPFHITFTEGKEVGTDVNFHEKCAEFFGMWLTYL